MSKRLTKEEFIERSRKIHGDKYDYSQAEYIDNRTKVKIICKEHGVFEQRPEKHFIGHGCPFCAKNKKRTQEEFIQKAREIHGGTYDYSQVIYINNETKVKITCKEHGVFEQTPHNHLSGQGCPLCGLKKQSVPILYEEFIKRAKEIHGDKYVYSSKEKYVNIQTKFPIICKEHGIFEQRPYAHIAGNGCPKCASEKNGLNKRSNIKAFIQKAIEVHGDKYNYEETEYVTATQKIKIICPKHGEFWQTPDHHLNGCGCPKCNHSVSKDEEIIYKYVCGLVGEENVIQGDRTILNGKELDIYIPSKNVAIEYNGLYWHNSKIVGKNYHIDKLNECKKKGIKLLQIFEDEFKETPKIVFNKIAHILKCQQELPRIMARKCEIKEVDKEIAREFLNTYHIQGYSPSTVYLGAFYNNNLMGVMSFKREFKGETKWELTRFASNYNYIFQGLGGKLFKYFIKNHDVSTVKSFADRRWTVDEENNVYIQLNFTFEKYTKVDYRYYNPKEEGCKRIHKFGCRRETLNKKFGLPLTMTEREMTEELGYERIYDCGLIKYVWNNA